MTFRIAPKDDEAKAEPRKARRKTTIHLIGMHKSVLQMEAFLTTKALEKNLKLKKLLWNGL